MKARLRYIIILLCLFLGCGGMYARSKLVKTINILDTEFMEVVYAHVTNDTVLNKSKADYEILILGHNYNKYGGYGNFQLDSILREDPLLECAPTFEDFQKLSRSLGKIRESMTLCHSDSTVSFYGNIFINYYNYKEKTPEIEWLLADSETEKIMGYECCKATAKWRGREWTAWYSDIPYPFDPWKFGGLPGLILKLQDNQKGHLFMAVGLKEDLFPFGYDKRAYTKTDRNKYNEALEDMMLNSGKIIAEYGMVKLSDAEKRNMRKRRLLFNPIELE